MLVAIVVAVLYSFNTPQPFQPYHDSYEYVFSARRILAGGPLVNADRLPGYPLLLALVFALRGKVDLHAAQDAQYALFVLSALEVYILTYRIWRRATLAALIGVLFGSNLYLLEYVKPILSDALAMCLSLALCLAIVYFIERPRPLRVWAVAVVLVALTMTRAEWYLAPIGIFPFLWLIAVRAKRGKRIAPHALLALLAVLGVVVLYMRENAAISGYNGLSVAENINLWAKVVQYHMTSQAPAKYAGIAAITQQGAKRFGDDVWNMYWHNPVLGTDHFGMVGKFAKAVILAHPVEFLWKSLPLMFTTLPIHSQWGGIVAHRANSAWLYNLLSYSAGIFPLFVIFPLIGVWNLCLWAGNWVRTAFTGRPDAEIGRAELQVTMTAALALLGLYDLALTTLGSYGEYERLHLAFDPLMLIVIVGFLFSVAVWLWARITQPRAYARNSAKLAANARGSEKHPAATGNTAVTRSKWELTRPRRGDQPETKQPTPDELEEASAV